MVQYFDKQRGFAIGIVTTGNAVGGMIYPIVVRELMPKVRRSMNLGSLEFRYRLRLTDTLHYLDRFRVDRESARVY